MANSVYEYVKVFELDDTVLPQTWMVIRVDGIGFHGFTKAHNFTKPNDDRALGLMNKCATRVMEEYSGDVVLAIGMSDEYSFIIHPQSQLFSRRASKLNSSFTSLFTSNFVYFWRDFFPDVPLQYPPHFDGRVVSYPTDQSIKDYLSWRQVDAHINNLYNTCFYHLFTVGLAKDEKEAHELMLTKYKNSKEKHELLNPEGKGINYNNLSKLYRKGSILVWKEIEVEVETDCKNSNAPSSSSSSSSSTTPSTDEQKADAPVSVDSEKKTFTRKKRVVTLIHDDLVPPSDVQFYTELHPHIIPYVSPSDIKKLEKEKLKKTKKQAYREKGIGKGGAVLQSPSSLLNNNGNEICTSDGSSNAPPSTS